MPFLFSLLLWFLINHVITINGTSEDIIVQDGAKCKGHLYYKVDKCMPGGYIHHWRCDGPWRRTYWRRMKEHDRHCSGETSRCFCERFVYDDFENYLCKCVQAIFQPNFPSTGILEFTQKVRFTYDGFSPWVEVETHEEIHRHEDGHYLRKYADFDWFNATLPWEYKFEIFLPMKNGKFKKFTGRMKDGICQVEIVTRGGPKFDALWDWKHLHTLSNTIKKSKTITTQVWERDFYIDVEKRSKWTVDFDSSRNVAFPLSQTYSYSDYYVDYHRRLTKTFGFTDIVKGEASFDVDEYCKNDVNLLMDTR